MEDIKSHSKWLNVRLITLLVTSFSLLATSIASCEKEIPAEKKGDSDTRAPKDSTGNVSITFTIDREWGDTINHDF